MSFLSRSRVILLDITSWTKTLCGEVLLIILHTNTHTDTHIRTHTYTRYKAKCFYIAPCLFANTHYTFLGKCLDVLQSEANCAYALMRDFFSKYLLTPTSLCSENALHVKSLGLSLGSHNERQLQVVVIFRIDILH